VIQEGFDRWQIGERVLFTITNNGGNIKNACVDDLEILHIPCNEHTLQLGVKKCFDIRRVSTALAHCRKLVGFFMMYALRENQQQLKIKQHKLIQDCVPRWGSTLSIIDWNKELQFVLYLLKIEMIML